MLAVYLLIFVAGCRPSEKPNENVDHLILAVSDLAKGMEEFEALTGVKPVFGGEHPNSFTHNALVSLGGDTYLEILAPRPNATNVPEEFKRYTKLTPWGWAIRSRNIDKTRAILQKIGTTCSDNAPGSRATPSGALLSWTTFQIEDGKGYPFIIEWGKDVVHPSSSTQAGCQFVSLSHDRPGEQRLAKIIEALNLPAESQRSDSVKISFVIDSPKGRVKF